MKKSRDICKAHDVHNSWRERESERERKIRIIRIRLREKERQERKGEKEREIERLTAVSEGLQWSSMKLVKWLEIVRQVRRTINLNRKNSELIFKTKYSQF